MPLFNKLVTTDALPSHQRKIPLLSPLTGKVDSLDSLANPIYQQRLMGEGAIIETTGYQLVAPFDGKVIDVTTMGNRLELRSSQGIRLHIQMGIDSDSMMGEGFKKKCDIEQGFSKGQTLIEFDLNKMKRKLQDPRSVVTILNSDKLKGVVIPNKQVMAGLDPLLHLLI